MRMFRPLWFTLYLAGTLYTCNAELVPLIGRDPAELEPVTGVGHGGWTFYVNAPLTVSALGFYDYQGDGLFEDQHIAIWKDLSGQTTWPFINPLDAIAIASNTIPKGPDLALIGSYRIITFNTPLTLEPGGYEIAGLDPTSSELGKYLNGNDPVSPRVDERILLGAPALGTGSPPGEYIAAYGAYLGPMLFVQVPEPSLSSLLMLAGVLAVGRRFLTRKR